MKVLVDTNVILDVLLKRDGLYAESFEVFRLAEQRNITGCVSSSAITDIFYLVHKAQKNIDAVYQAIEGVSVIFTIAPVAGRGVLTQANTAPRPFIPHLSPLR
jgi:predicted nucleic acid-binding protein